MRQKVTTLRLEQFMKSLGATVKSRTRVYLVGGATSVLLGWRESTIDVDLKIIPEADDVLRSIPELKERLQMNIELASPDHFIPELPGWQERSRYIRSEGPIEFFHYDFYAQALAKIERGHAADRGDVADMMSAGLIEPSRLLELFTAIEDSLYKYPALDPATFRRAVERVVRESGSSGNSA